MPKVYGIIPARINSKGIPKKNLELVGGLSLVSRAVRSAYQSGCVDNIVVSTDSPEVMQDVQHNHPINKYIKHGFYDRPKELYDDDAPCIDVVKFYLDHFCMADDDVVLLLQPTSPHRNGLDINVAVQMVRDNKASAAISVTHAKPPHTLRRLDRDKGCRLFMANGELVTPARGQRQDYPLYHRVNGAVFCSTAGQLRSQGTFHTWDSRGFVMPTLRSVEIDDYGDLELARAIHSHLEKYYAE